MRIVRIQENQFEAESRPTTQEDNYGNIVERYDLYIDNIVVGKLVKYNEHDTDIYAVFHSVGTSGHIVKYEMLANEIQFIPSSICI